MAAPDYTDLVAGHRAYFNSGATRPVAWRREQLEAIKALLNDNRAAFYEALRHDLRRNDVDSELMDVGNNIKDADHALAHLQQWMKPERVHTPIILEPGHIRVRRDPLA